MASQYAFQFGVEIELLIGSRSKNHKTWRSLADEISSKLIKAGVPNHVNESAKNSSESYQEWSIVPEVTVPSQAGKGLWGVELVSPILNPPDEWAADLGRLFKTLKSYFTLAASPNTSTHIHLSTSPLLHPSGVATLAKSSLYFERAIDSLLPKDRRGDSYWCQRNRTNPFLKPRSMSEVFHHLNYCQGVEDVVHAMNLYPAKSGYGASHGYKADFVHHGVHKWDFTRLLSAGPNGGTIEFRQCPGSRSADEVVTWVLLAVGFAAESVLYGFVNTVDDPDGRGTRDDLYTVVGAGVESTGLLLNGTDAGQTLMETLFNSADEREREKSEGGGKKKGGRK